MTDRSLPARKILTVCAVLIGAGWLAGCETTESEGPAAAAAPAPGAAPAAQAAKPAEPPMTRTRAAEICWMTTEKGAASMSIDKRADLVDKCIADKLKAAAAPNG